MSYEPAPYWPTEARMIELGFWEGYGEIWLLDATDDTRVILDMDEFGTMGSVHVGEKQTHVAELENEKDLLELIEAAKAPF